MRAVQVAELAGLVEVLGGEQDGDFPWGEVAGDLFPGMGARMWRISSSEGGAWARAQAPSSVAASTRSRSRSR